MQHIVDIALYKNKNGNQWLNLTFFTKKNQIWSLDSDPILVYDIMGHIIWDISYVPYYTWAHR